MSAQKTSSPVLWRVVAIATALVLCFLIATAYTSSGAQKHLRNSFTNHPNEEAKDDVKAPEAEPELSEKQGPPWLIATITPVDGLQRRSVIRNTWQKLYANPDQFQARFVVANITYPWGPLIEAENATYGDIISLSNIPEDAGTANSIKTVEFFKYLVHEYGQRFQFVSKIDDDSYLDVPRFWDKYLKHLANGDEEPANTAIGRKLNNVGGYNWTFPGGQFYTLTWDMVEVAAEQYEEHGMGPVHHEDALIGWLLDQGGADWHLVQLPSKVAYDFGGGPPNGPRGKDSKHDSDYDNPWAPKSADLNAWSHGVGPGSINPHKMKSDYDYLRVAACFDKNGVKVKEWT